jgi:mono/diheme cytochrome c family protein
MLRSTRCAALVALLAAAAGCEALEHRTPGERLWRRYCAECHGLDAAGNTVHEMGNAFADLRDDQWRTGGDDETIEQVIREGVFSQMPAHDELSSEDVRAIIFWLRHLRGETE